MSVIGKDYESRKLSQEVRDLALAEARDILKRKKKVSKEFYQALLLKLAGAALPRLNEVSGADGSRLVVNLTYTNGCNKEISQLSMADTAS